jgi:hypothetical protein
VQDLPADFAGHGGEVLRRDAGVTPWQQDPRVGHGVAAGLELAAQDRQDLRPFRRTDVLEIWQAEGPVE